MSRPDEQLSRTPREVRYDAAGATLFALDQGAGPPLLFLHGGMGDHRASLPVVGPLCTTYRVVTPDIRGAGRSIYWSDLSWDLLASDVVRLLDLLRIDRAVLGGTSAGSAVALRVALRHPERARALLLVAPVFRGAELGLTSAQRAAMERMDRYGRLAAAEGIEALFPLYDALPPAIRQRALVMAASFDARSVAATTRFFASGVQPFHQLSELASVVAPTLVLPGEDAEHPHEVAELYARHLPHCEVAAPGSEPTRTIERFCAALAET